MRDHWGQLTCGLIIVGLVVFAANHVKPHAASYHDGTRLAAIESVSLRGTLAIDDSPFAQPIPPVPSVTCYPREIPALRNGTLDKYFVNGHFYSHHPPISLWVFGGVYRLWLQIGGPDPAQEPQRFIQWMSILHSIVPFALTLILLTSSLGKMGLNRWQSCLVLVAFGGGTMMLAYTQCVNYHILVLMLFAAVLRLMIEPVSCGRAIVLGNVLGAIYTLDGALGPVTAICVAGSLAWQRRWWPLILTGLAALPWAVLHHLIIYHITGEFGSPATNPKFWQWEGSGFDAESLTGAGFKHDLPGACDYGASLLFDSRGFIVHNPMVLIAIVGAVVVAIWYPADRLRVLSLLTWFTLCQLPYVLMSNNAGGGCLSIRWYLPLLIPAAAMLGLSMQRLRRWGFVVLASLPANFMLASHGIRFGPWYDREHPEVLHYALGTWLSAGIAWLLIQCFAKLYPMNTNQSAPS